MEGIRPVVIEPSALAPGDVLGRHELLMPIAKGGMGQVWAARLHGTRGFQKLVAIKTILPSGEDAGQLESMLFEEASLAALVRHPNVAETLDLGEREDGTMYLVMEWVSGEPLDHILRVAEPVGGVPIAMLVRFAIQALCGLRAVHEARSAGGEPLGIVHRDVSLQNLLVTYEGVVKLIDFGIAKATQQMSRNTEEGMVKGKFAYMSPEQLRSDPVDARADLFGLAVVLYRATTRKHPFQGDNLAATMRNILMAAPQRPSALVPGYSRALEEVVLKALSKERSDRFGSAHEMMLALEQAFPEACSSGIDERSETLLRRLFADRIAERTRALQVAMKAADNAAAVKVGDSTPRFPRSLSTMRAVSRDSFADDGDGPIEQDQGDPVGDSDSVHIHAAKRRAAASIGIAAGVAALLATGLVGSYMSKSLRGGQMGVAPANGRNTSQAPVSQDDPYASVPRPPASPSGLQPAPTSSASASVSVAASGPSRLRPVVTPKRRAAQLAEPDSVTPPAGAAQPPPAVGTGASVDPLSRRK